MESMAATPTPVNAPDEAPAPRAPLSRPRLWRRRLTQLLGLACALWLLRFVYLRLTVMPTPRPGYWEAKIAALDPPRPDALPAEEAEQLLQPGPWEQDQTLISLLAGSGRVGGSANRLLRGKWDEEREDIIAASRFVRSKAFVEAREELLRSLEHGWCRGVSAGGATLSPDWANVLPWVGWLQVHARWSQCQGEAMEVPVEDWIACFRLGRELSRSRRLQDQYGAWIAQENTARQMLIAATELHGEIDTLALARGIDALNPASAQPSALLEGERLYMHALLERVYARERGDWLVVSRVPSLYEENRGRAPVSAPGVWNLTAPLFHDLPTARQRVDTYFASLDRCTCLAKWAETSGFYSASGDFWTRLRPGPLDGIEVFFGGRYAWPDVRLRRYYWMRGTTDAAMTMLALAGYHRAHGSYPSALEELVPAWLPRLPIDFADLQVLRYRRLESGFLLYSVGEDGRDNLGRGDLNQELYYYSTPDVVFSAAKRPELLFP